MFWNQTIGQKYRMSSMQAALGMAQLERLPELIERKRSIFDWYRRELGNLPGIALNSEASDVFNVYWMVTVVLDPELGWTKEKLVPALREHNVDCRPFFYPLSMLPAYQSFPTAAAARARNSASYAVVTLWRQSSERAVAHGGAGEVRRRDVEEFAGTRMIDC